jgi:hypothetical protein
MTGQTLEGNVKVIMEDSTKLKQSLARIQVESKAEFATEKEKLLEATSMISCLEKQIYTNKLESENATLELSDSFAGRIGKLMSGVQEMTDKL